MDKQTFHGPLHLQRNLTPCTDSFNDVMRAALSHPLTVVSALQCDCATSTVVPVVKEPPVLRGVDTEILRRRIESSRRMAEAGEGGDGAKKGDSERRQQCRFFSVKLNDEQGIVLSFCRRCSKRVIVYDRDLYWGVRRESVLQPETFPYKCTCGSHTFEVAVGFEYPDEAMDENDINTISVGVRCASCNQVAIVFDDEAT